MATFLRSHNVPQTGLKACLLGKAEQLKRHALDMSTQTGRPYLYVNGPTRKEEMARDIAARDHIEEGLVAIISVVEPCRTFSLVWRNQKTFIRSARRKCLCLYYYFIDRDLGLIHVKVQTWFPFRIQVYVNGHDWLARKLTHHRIGFVQHDNAFVRIDDMKRAQAIADKFTTLPWVTLLNRYARRVNPLLGRFLGSMSYYWVTAQAEFSTDVLFKSRTMLAELMPRLLEHSIVSFDARDVMSFLGRKLRGNFRGDLVSDLRELDLHGRLPGRRVKHRMKANWIKMYDKGGCILRVETVINEPEEFRVRRRVRRNGKRVTLWVPMRKGVRFLFRYRDVSLKSNLRYLDALAEVADPSSALQKLDRISTRRANAKGRTVRPFNPIAPEDHTLFKALLAGEHMIHGFSNRQFRTRLNALGVALPAEARRQSSYASRLLARLHTYGLVAKIPRSRRWRVSADGLRIMSAALHLRDQRFPALHDQEPAPALAA